MGTEKDNRNKESVVAPRAENGTAKSVNTKDKKVHNCFRTHIYKPTNVRRKNMYPKCRHAFFVW